MPIVPRPLPLPSDVAQAMASGARPCKVIVNGVHLGYAWRDADGTLHAHRLTAVSVAQYQTWTDEAALREQCLLAEGW
jgi:hypothetical protein